MKPTIYRFNDDPEALVDVARTIDANAEAARAFGKNNDHEGMAELDRAIIDEGRDQNAGFAASELWAIYQRATRG
jgi:hypothetical protein